MGCIHHEAVIPPFTLTFRILSVLQSDGFGFFYINWGVCIWMCIRLRFYSTTGSNFEGLDLPGRKKKKISPHVK